MRISDWSSDVCSSDLTADDTPDLIVRTKTANDSAVPSGNGTMLAVLARLHYLTGRADYRQRAEDLMTAFSGEITRNFFPLATLMNAAELRSEESRVGKECVSTCRSRGSAST